MYIDGEVIRLDPEKDSIDASVDDWAINAEGQMMRHIPTEVTFRIEISEEARKAGHGNVFDFLARPVHIGTGHALPDAATITELGRIAIVLFVYGCGLIDPRANREDAWTAHCAPDLNEN